MIDVVDELSNEEESEPDASHKISPKPQEEE